MKNWKNWIIPVGVIAIIMIGRFFGPASLFCTIGGLIAGHIVGQIETIERINERIKNG